MDEKLKGLWVKREPEKLTIAWRRRLLAASWLTEGVLFIFGAAFLGSSLPQLIVKYFGKNPRGFQGSDLFAIFFMLIGGLLVYRTLALFINTDRIVVTPLKLKISSAPLAPWEGTNGALSTSEIERVETSVVTTSAGKNRMRAGVTVTYSVNAILYDGATRALVSGSSKAEPMYFIGNEIDNFLKTIKGAAA